MPSPPPPVRPPSRPAASAAALAAASPSRIPSPPAPAPPSQQQQQEQEQEPSSPPRDAPAPPPQQLPRALPLLSPLQGPAAAARSPSSSHRPSARRSLLAAASPDAVSPPSRVSPAQAAAQAAAAAPAPAPAPADPHMLLVGSPWVYANITAVRSMTRGRGRLIDVQFNHIGHLPKLLEIMPEVDLVLAASERLRTLLVDYYEVPKPVRVLYIAPPEIDESLARPVGTPPRERLRIGWLGRNSPEKRPDLVATIAAAVPEADFVMAGSRLSQLPEQPDNVDVAGWVADPIEFLAGLDAILNTSDIEGISVTAMEALQLGVPVITRDVGGMAELVRDGENGLVYSEADIHLLARRLRDRDLVERVTAQAQAERLPAVFHFGQMVETVREAVTGG